MSKHFDRIAEMLSSVNNALNTESVAGRAMIARGMLGSIKPRNEMLAICPQCAWKGRIEDCQEKLHESDSESWRRHAGRRGWHWCCPQCGELIWRYYNEIN